MLEVFSGEKVGFKVAGGIRSTVEALGYQAMVEEILGAEWLEPNLFRIGASSLLDDIIKELDKKYSRGNNLVLSSLQLSS